MLNTQIIKKQFSEPPPNPEEFLSGVCGTCRNRVSCKRKNASTGGDFKDLLSTECSWCKARIYLRTEDKSLDNQLQNSKQEIDKLLDKNKEQETTIKELREIKTTLESAVDKLTKEKPKSGLVSELFDRMEEAMKKGEDLNLSVKDQKILEVLECDEIPDIPEGWKMEED